MPKGLRLGSSVLVVALLCSGCDWLVRAAVDNGGDVGNAPSGWSAPSISGDGRYVVFNSSASNLVPDDGNGRDDIFVRDARAGTTQRVSVNVAGGDANGNSGDASISADGRIVAFETGASNLVPGDHPNGGIYVRDLELRTTTLVAANATGDHAISHIAPSVSANGRFVVFTTLNVDQVGSADDVVAVSIRDLEAATTTLVSAAPGGVAADGTSGLASVSADGRLVAFQSNATDLVQGDDGPDDDVFVRDLQTTSTTRVSVDTAGGEPDPRSSAPAISADGRYVVFSSDATDLVAGGAAPEPGRADVFVRDLQLGLTRQVSVDTAGGDPDGASGDVPNLGFGGPAISADGRYVAFSSIATDLVARDRDATEDVFVRDLATNTTAFMSADRFGLQADNFSGGPDISGDGRYVAFKSFAGNLAGPRGGGGDWDVFVAAVVKPTISAVAPSTVTRRNTATLRLTGTGFFPGVRVSPQAFGPEGLTVNSVTVVSETELEVSVTVGAGAAVGARTVMVWNPGTGPGDLATDYGFCVGCLSVG